MNAIPVPYLARKDSTENLVVFGVNVQVLANRAQTAGEFCTYIAECAPGIGAPLHRHTGQDESFFVLTGEFDIRCGDQVSRLKAGDFAFVPRGQAHAFTAAGDKPARLLGFGNPGGHEAFFEDCAAALAVGSFSPETGRQICEKHGIELLKR
jgi:quercetin dioxygenase-like cupin family protein